MEIPGVGEVARDDLGSYYSKPLFVPVLGKSCQVVLDGYDDDFRQDEFHSVIANFLQLSPSALTESAAHVYRYYQKCNSNWDADDPEFLTIENPSEVWHHVRIGNESVVSRRAYGDKAIYVSVECNCDWEPEHGLQIVFKNGLRVNKIGPYDGHLTNSDAFADKSLECVVFVE